MSKNYELKGVGETVELGKEGPIIKAADSGAVEHRNNSDDDFSIVRAAHPIGDNDVVTMQYLKLEIERLKAELRGEK